MERKIVDPWGFQKKFGFVPGNAISHGEHMLFCAGQLSVNEDGEPIHGGDMAAQINQALDNIETVLEIAGYSFADVMQLRYYTTDLDAFFANREVLGGRLMQTGCQPASTLVEVSRLAFPGMMIEIEATAVK